jgi:hypothetical protein
MIALPVQLPFVRAAVDVMDGRARPGAAIAAFVAAERRHRIRVIHDPESRLPSGLLSPADGRRHTLRELLVLQPFEDADPKTGVPVTREAWQYHGENEIDAAALDAFISATFLVLAGIDFTNHHAIEHAGGIIESRSQRGWGQRLAEWATASNLEQPALWEGGEMTYATFAFYVDRLVERYDRYAEVVLEVIHRKCEDQLDEIGP